MQNVARKLTVQRTAKTRSDLVVCLTTDVAGLGIKDDQVIVKAGRMRNELFPNGLALYTNNKGKVIPNTPFGSILLPASVLQRNAIELARRETQRVMVEAEQVPREQIKPASEATKRPTAEELETQRQAAEASRQAAVLREERIRDELSTVGVLSFVRKGTESGDLYGSVTADDVRASLQQEYDIVGLGTENVRFAGDLDRVRKFGQHTVFFSLPAIEHEATLTINVTSDDAQ